MRMQTAAPPAPPNAPSDWTSAVHGNCFSNLQRLGLWAGGTIGVAANASPSCHFQPVTRGSLGCGDSPPAIYVLTHGWAPGYRAAVNAEGGNLLWWGSNASVGNTWASNWAWSPTSVDFESAPPFPVNQTGALQAIVMLDPKAEALAYSWIDDSATDSGVLNLDEVYESEAYTHINGIRLANALEEAIAPSFWDAPGAILRLVGHSHGSKVVTVAALTLQQRGRKVAHITLLDPPESESTLIVNGANLLGFYLESLQIADPSCACAGGCFVDHYLSYFAVGYSGNGNLQNIVKAALYPFQLYYGDPSNSHGYAATWYAGAAEGANLAGEPPLGLAWPPFPSVYTPALNQTWPGGTSQAGQWQLQPGALNSFDSYSYSTQPLTVSAAGTQADSSGTVTLGPNNGAYSIFHGSYANSEFGDGYGLAIDIDWTGPQAGDYLVVSMESPVEGELEVLLVMDGQSFPSGLTSVAINSNARNLFSSSLDLYVYFLAAGNSNGQVVLSNFRLVEVGSASGALRANRLAAAKRPG